MKDIPLNTIIRKYQWLILGASALLFVISIPYSHLFFLNDDFTSILVGSKLQFTYGYNTRIIPAISTYIDYRLYRTQPGGYIFTNVVLHLLCCGAGYSWYKQLCKEYHVQVPKWGFLGSILLFMWFGFHSEVILWMVCRTASIGLLCFFGSWFCFFRMPHKFIWTLAGFGCVLSGLLSYEVLIWLPLQIAAWYLFSPDRTNRSRPLNAVVASVAAICCYVGIKYIVAHQLSDNYGIEHFTGFDLPVLVKNYCALLVRTFAPPLVNKWFVIGIGSAILLLLATASIKLMAAQRVDAVWKFLLFNWLGSYVIFCSLGIDLSGNESDRYLYIPSFFCCLWLVYSLYLLQLKPLVSTLAVGILFSYHVGCFCTSIANFRQAGSVARHSLHTIYQHHADSGTIIQNLPAKVYGVPVLRSGVKNGLIWLYPKMDTANITVESQIVLPVNFNSGPKPFFLQSYDTAKGAHVVRFFPDVQNGSY